MTVLAACIVVVVLFRSLFRAPTALIVVGLLELACSKTPPADANAGIAPRETPSAPAAHVGTPPVVDAGHPLGPPADLNMLLITVDCLRADMPWAGYERPIAPNLTDLEKRAVSYTNAYSLSSYTSMSVGGMLGGRYPGEMKRDGYFFGHYRDNPMFPERLQAAGIRTVSAHAHLPAKGRLRAGLRSIRDGPRAEMERDDR